MLSPSLLLQAYATGWFPMGSEAAGPDGVEWFSPDPRALIPLDDRFHVPQRLGRVLRSRRFAVRVDTAFHAVIRACAARDDTWITEVIERAYLELHRLGFAHSVEAWREGRLAGGLYGVALRGAFFGESMFHREADASKVALCGLVDRLRARGFVLLDTQWVTAHLAQFGAFEVPRRRYLRLLEAALRRDCQFHDRD
jgi:leucyl/phenylalanyl-tRNA--protein transferase